MQRLTGYISHVAPERIVSQLTCSRFCRLHDRLTESFHTPLLILYKKVSAGLLEATPAGGKSIARIFVFVLQRDEQTAAYEESLTSDITHKPLQECTQPHCPDSIPRSAPSPSVADLWQRRFPSTAPR